MIRKFKNTLKREVIKLSASFLIGLVLLSACKKEVTTIGNDINPNGLTIITQDSFTVHTSSALVDSLPVDETSVSLLGGLNDPEFGLVDCGIVTQVRLSSEAPDFGDISQITVDSVVLAFQYVSNKFYGNVTELSFSVVEIGDNLVREDQDYYKNTPITTVGSELIKPGTETIKPNPFKKVIVGSDTLDPMLRLQLDPSFGTYLINNSSEMSTNDNFLNFFKGLYVKATNTSSLSINKGTVLYFSLESALSNLVLYYSIGGESKKFTFNINSNCARFNQMDFDRTGTPVEQSISNFEAAQDKFYMQGSNIRPEFQFPHILEFGKDKNRVINKAELIVPVQNFTSSPFGIENGLFIGRIKNKLETSLSFDYQSFSTVNYDQTNKTFTFNLTRDLQRVVSGEIENVGYRLYPTNFFGSTIERIIFSGPKANTKDKTKLRITYTEY